MSYENNKLMNLEDGQLLLSAIDKKTKEELSEKANADNLYAYKETSGSIVTVDDAVADAVKKLQIEIAPVQDLHGYANPWPAGGGKNLIQPITTATDNGVTFTQDGNYIKMSGTATSNASCILFSGVLPAGTYTLNGMTGAGTSSWRTGYRIGSGSWTYNTESAMQISADGTSTFDIRLFAYPAYGAFNNVKVQYQLESGSTATAWTPYENSCPISGWEYANVWSAGRNLIIPHPVGTTKTQSGITGTQNADGSVTFDGTATGTFWGIGNSPMFLLKAGTYMIEQSEQIQNVATILAEHIEGGSDKAIKTIGLDKYSAFTLDHDSIVYTYYKITSGASLSNKKYWVWLVAGSNRSSFEQYQGSTYTISFPSSAGTVYGGTLTINRDGTGELVVDHGFVDTQSNTWTLNAINDHGIANFKYYKSPLEFDYTEDIITNLLPHDSTSQANATKPGYTVSGASTLYVRLYSSEASTVGEFKQWASANGLQILLKLATPVTYELSSQQVVQLLNGTNNVWADTGDILSMLYPTLGQYSKEESDERYAGMITESIDTPADIASFSDGADDIPMALRVAVEPMQDLHGFDNPWPAGGGKNLLDLSKVTLFNGAYGLSYSLTDNIFRVYGTVTTPGSGAFAIFQYADTSLSGRNLVVQAQDVTGGTITNIYGFRTSTEKDVAIAINRTEGETVDIKFKVTVAETSQSEWTPYSNICPISGWTGANVTRTVTNIWDEEWDTNGSYVRSKNFIPCKPNTTYYFSAPANPSNGIKYYDKDKNQLAGVRYNAGPFTTPDNCYFIWFGMTSNYGTTYNHDISINYPATDTAYHPGHVNTYSITFPQDAGTVYGGILTINRDGTGELVVDRAINTLNGTQPLADNGTLSYGGMQARYIPTPSKKWAASVDVGEGLMSDKFYIQNPAPAQKPFMLNGRTTNGNIYLNMPSDVTSAEAAVAWFASNPTQVSYLLADPIVYQLTALEVIKTLKGLNNIFANTGKINAVEYSADTKLYIAKELSASQRLMELIVTANHEDEMKATKAYSTGNLLIVNGTLYKATASIANGATLTVGTNVTATTVANELAALA